MSHHQEGTEGAPAPWEQTLFRQYEAALRLAGAESLFYHVPAQDGGRFPLTGVGDVNLYALFAELDGQLRRPDGRAGFIVPTGIATDDSTKAFFQSIVQGRQLASLYDFENKELFPAVHKSYKFSLITLSSAEQRTSPTTWSTAGADRQTAPFYDDGRGLCPDQPEYGHLPSLPVWRRRPLVPQALPPRIRPDAGGYGRKSVGN